MTATVPAIGETAYQDTLAKLYYRLAPDGECTVGPVPDDELGIVVLGEIVTLLDANPLAEAGLQYLAAQQPRRPDGSRRLNIAEHQDWIAALEQDIADGHANAPVVTYSEQYAVAKTLLQAENAGTRALKATTYPLTHRSLDGLVDRVLTAAPHEQLRTLRWAESILARHVWIGDLARDDADVLVDRLLAKLPNRPPQADGTPETGRRRMDAATRSAYLDVLEAAGDTARAILDEEWIEQTRELLRGPIGKSVRERWPHLDHAELWASLTRRARQRAAASTTTTGQADR